MAETGICINIDGCGGFGIVTAPDIHGPESGIRIYFSVTFCGNQNGQGAKSAVGINAAIRSKAFQLGQIQRHMAETDICVTVAKGGQVDDMGL